MSIVNILIVSALTVPSIHPGMARLAQECRARVGTKLRTLLLLCAASSCVRGRGVVDCSGPIARTHTFDARIFWLMDRSIAMALTCDVDDHFS